MGKNTGQREIRPVWNNTQRINHQNKFVPTAVLTRSGKIPVSTAKQYVNTATPKNRVNVSKSNINTFLKPHSPIRMPFYKSTVLNTMVSKEKVNTVRVNGVNTAGQIAVSTVKGNGVIAVKASAGYGNPQQALKYKEMFDSGCSRHMTRNKALLTDYQDIDRGFVAFGGSTRGEAIIDESKLWHRRLGHVNFKTMNKLVKGNLVRGLPSKTFENDHTCVACQKGKQHKASCKTKHVSSISQPLQMLHMDLFGPTSVRSINHKTYCLVVTDDFSRFSWVFFLATKSETSRILKKFITEVENKLNHNVKIIRSDNGTKFKNKEMDELCGQKGIKREYSIDRTQQQNGVAERKNKTLIEAARTMLADSLLPIVFWAEAVNTACYVLNRFLVTKPHNKTPYELIIGRAPSISFMRLFGYPITILNTLDPLGKFDGKVEEGRSAATQQYIVFPLWSSISSSYKSSDDKAEDDTVDDDACKKTVQEPASEYDQALKNVLDKRMNARRRSYRVIMMLVRKELKLSVIPDSSGYERIARERARECVSLVERPSMILETRECDNGYYIAIWHLNAVIQSVDAERSGYRTLPELQAYLDEKGYGYKVEVYRNKKDRARGGISCKAKKAGTGSSKDIEQEEGKLMNDYCCVAPVEAERNLPIPIFKEGYIYRLLERYGNRATHRALNKGLMRIENPTIHVSFVEQFWRTTTARTSANGEVKLTATIDGQVKTITEASLRRHLKLENNGGVTTLPNSEIFEQLALMGYLVPPSTSQPLNTQPTPDAEEAVPMPYESPLHSVHSLGRDEGSSSLKELTDLCTFLSKKVEGLESEDEDAPDYSSKQGRKISDIDEDPNISLVQDEGMTWFQDADAEIQEKNSADTEILLQEEEPTKLVEDQGSGEKGEKEVSTVRAEHSTVIPEVSTTAANLQERLGNEEDVRLQEQLNEEETQRIARDGEIARQLHEEINKVGQERVVAKDDQAHVIDWSDPAVLRYHAQLNRPYSVAEVRRIMGHVWDQIQSFIPMDSEDKEKDSKKKAGGSRKKTLARKRAGEKQSDQSAKRQKTEYEREKEELKVYLDLVPREEFAMDFESLYTKYPIVDWKTHVLTENFMYYQIIKADGGSKNYKIFSEMLDDFDKQDVIDLHRLVEERYATSRPEGYDLMLWGDLKILFQPDEEDEFWKHQHEYNLISWRLFDSCGIHILLTDNGISIHMMTEKKYPLLGNIFVSHIVYLDLFKLAIGLQKANQIQDFGRTSGIRANRGTLNETSNYKDASDTGAVPKQQQQVIPQITAILNIKLPILKMEEYDIWAMEMKHYLEYIDNDVWKKRKAKNILSMAIPKEHMRRFHGMDDAKEIWEAIRTRFGEGLKKGYDRFQQLLSQLEAHGAEVSTEDVNHKFLKSLPPAWSNLAMTMRTKPDVDTLSIDDLYNNLRVFEQEIQGATCTPSTSLTNIPEKEALASFADEVIYSLFAKQSKDCDLLHEDLEQIDDLDIEEMDINWQITMIAIRMKKFYKKTRRRGTHDGKKKRDSFYQHQEAGKQEKNQMGLLTMDDGIVNWGEHTEDEETNHALMAISSSSEANEIYEKDEKLKKYRRIGMKAVKEKEQLQKTLDSWKDSSKNLWRLINSGMSSNSKVEEDSVGKPLYSRFIKTNDFKAMKTTEKGVSAPKSKEVELSCVSHIKTPRQPIKDQATPKVNRMNWNAMMERELGEGYSFTKKKCFVCGSLSHLIKDCDYYEKKIAKVAEVKKQRVCNTGNIMAKPVWTNTNGINHANQFVPRPVQLNTSRPNINYVRTNINTGRTNINYVRTNINTGRTNINYVRPRVNTVNTVRFKQPVPTRTSNYFSPKRPQGKWGYAVKTSAGYNWRNS
ncbi:putative ribonuclease H-like domain-containing protein, partial [Tanacetum coccineum]